MQQGSFSWGQSLFQSPISVGVLGLLVFCGALLWAHHRKPYKVDWINLRSASGEKVDVVEVSSRLTTNRSAILYLHDKDGSLEGDGNDIRHLAAAGFDVFSLHYDPKSPAGFDQGFQAVWAYVAKRYDSAAWVGIGLGANRLIRFLGQHSERPKALLLISPTVKEGDPAQMISDAPLADVRALPILVLRGLEDDEFSEQIAHNLSSALEEKGGVVERSNIPRAPQNLEPWRRAIFRVVGEYARIKLNLPLPLESDDEREKTSWLRTGLYFLPAIGWGSFLVVRRSGSKGEKPSQSQRAIGKKWVILASACLALAVLEGGVRLILPRIPISRFRVSLAETVFFSGAPSDSWRYLSPSPIWRGKPLGALIEHVELSEYNRGLVNWEVNDALFKEFVLSPDLQGATGSDLKWRRLLWEEFYPHVRRFRSPEQAVRVAVRHLQERIIIIKTPGAPSEVRRIWAQRFTDEAGFRRLCIATLRSIGIPSRLSTAGTAEYWDGSAWSSAPTPLSIN